jgi:hypothetical protein
MYVPYPPFEITFALIKEHHNRWGFLDFVNRNGKGLWSFILVGKSI